MKSEKEKLFKNVYDKEADSIFRFCLLRVSERDQALDITQETFLRFWQGLLDDREMSNTRSFLFTIAHNLIIDWYRKKKSINFSKLQGDDGNGYFFDIEDTSFGMNIESGVEAKMLINKINELPDNYRHPLYLKFVEDLSPSEIGEILDITPNNVSVRINRGLSELKKKLNI